MSKINEILPDLGYKAIIKDKELILNYIDSKGNNSERIITLKSIKRVLDDYLLEGFCHKKQSNRSFKLSKIKLLVDNSTGEVIPDFFDYFLTLVVSEIIQEEYNDEKYYTEDYFTELFKRKESKYNTVVLDKLCNLYKHEEGNIEVKKTSLTIEYYDREKEKNYKIDRELMSIDRYGGYEFHLFFHWKDKKDIINIDIEDIHSVYDNMNGCFIENLPEYLFQLCINSPYYITNNIYNDTINEIDILVFLSKADGKMVKEERNIITDYIKTQYPQLDNEIFDILLKSHKVTNNRFKESVNYIKKNKSNLLENLNQAMKKIIEVDDKIDPMEQSTMDLFDKL